MKRKILIIISLLIYISIIFIAFNLNRSFSEQNGFSINSRYIWLNEENSTNSWVCFRKNFNLNNKIKKSYKASIAVDSKYWLYINGKIIVREGGLKRSKKNSIYYDEIDLTDYLEEGENSIAILVWHFGKVSFSHIDSSLGRTFILLRSGK